MKETISQIITNPFNWIAQAPSQNHLASGSWSRSLVLFFIGVLFQELAALLIRGHLPYPMFSLMIAVGYATLFALFLLILWAIAVDGIMQFRGYQGRFASLLGNYLQIYLIFALLLPWTQLFWGMGIVNASILFLGKAFLFGLVLLVHIRAVSGIYNCSRDEAFWVYIVLSIVLISGLFLLTGFGIGRLFL